MDIFSIQINILPYFDLQGDDNKGEGSPEVSKLAKVPSYGQISTDAAQQWEEFERAGPQSQNDEQSTSESTMAVVDSHPDDCQPVKQCDSEQNIATGDMSSKSSDQTIYAEDGKVP